jgi:hypothetical protein
VRRWVTGGAALLALLLPATAGAATLRVDNANTLDPVAVPEFAPGEAFFTLTATGPGGAEAAQSITCIATNLNRSLGIDYIGNGPYRATLTTYGSGDSTCARGPVSTTSADFAIDQSTRPLVRSRYAYRRPGSEDAEEITASVQTVPGADGYEVQVSNSARQNPDGSLAGDREDLVVDPTTGAFTFRPRFAREFTFVARALDDSEGRSSATPWSRPVRVRVLAPFDLLPTSFPDSVGPVYRLRALVREQSASGRVRVSIARGWTGRARYRSLGTTRVRRGRGTFERRFRARPGRYRLRYRYLGSATTAPGTATERILVRRTAVSRRG